MDAGSTFLLTELDFHLWIVLSDPKADAKQVLIVNLTTLTPLKEQVCIIEAGEHPWVRHRSCVNYGDAKTVALERLLQLKDGGKLALQAPLSSTLLQRVREGATLSTRMALRHADILGEQGLIDI